MKSFRRWMTEMEIDSNKRETGTESLARTYVADTPGQVYYREDGVPANCMGTSSSTPGTGGIDTYDPMLFRAKKKINKKTPEKRDDKPND